MPQSALQVTRRGEHLLNDDQRVIPRYLNLHNPQRVNNALTRLMEIPEADVSKTLRRVLRGFASRHRDIRDAFENSFAQAVGSNQSLPDVSEDRRLLIGAYFTMEYSIESAALFNPSMVPHPDQSDLPEGAVRFLMSLRATGEGHVSSIVFRRGILGPRGGLTFDPPPRYAHTARPEVDRTFEKAIFRRKLRDLGEYEEHAEAVFDTLDETFTMSRLRAALNEALRRQETPDSFRLVAHELIWLAKANYTFTFPEDCAPAETVIFPATEHEQRGMEDVRLVRFVEDDGEVMYYGTYTAFDGVNMHPMLLETPDFRTFHVSTLTGRYVRNKGMALFPRRVDDYYLMLARHDGENLYLLRSKNLYVWNISELIHAPQERWELLQVGNCGSPLETDDGWLVLTHGVGPVREYSIGALLLDRDDPARVIGRLREPLLSPTAEEREGYVPNVVYSCGSMIHHGQLIIPYAMSDSRTAFATVPLDPLLRTLKASGD